MKKLVCSFVIFFLFDASFSETFSSSVADCHETFDSQLFKNEENKPFYNALATEGREAFLLQAESAGVYDRGFKYSADGQRIDTDEAPDDLPESRCQDLALMKLLLTTPRKDLAKLYLALEKLYLLRNSASWQSGFRTKEHENVMWMRQVIKYYEYMLPTFPKVVHLEGPLKIKAFERGAVPRHHDLKEVLKTPSIAIIGAGIVGREYRELIDFKLTGIEFSNKIEEILKADFGLYPDILTIKESILKINFKESIFGLMLHTFSGIFEFNPHEKTEVFRKALEGLVEGGFLVIDVLDIEHSDLSHYKSHLLKEHNFTNKNWGTEKEEDRGLYWEVPFKDQVDKLHLVSPHRLVKVATNVQIKQGSKVARFELYAMPPPYPAGFAENKQYRRQIIFRKKLTDN